MSKQFYTCHVEIVLKLLGKWIFVVTLDACCVNANSLDMWLKNDTGLDKIVNVAHPMICWLVRIRHELINSMDGRYDHVSRVTIKSGEIFFGFPCVTELYETWVSCWGVFQRYVLLKMAVLCVQLLWQLYANLSIQLSKGVVLSLWLQ